MIFLAVVSCAMLAPVEGQSWLGCIEPERRMVVAPDVDPRSDCWPAARAVTQSDRLIHSCGWLVVHGQADT